MSESPKIPTIESEPELIAFPIKDAEETIYSVEPQYYFRETKDSGIIYKIKRSVHYTELNDCTDFSLRMNIANEDFLFRIVEAYGHSKGTYSIDFMSEKYQYSLMEFTNEETRQLELVITSFINTVFSQNPYVKKIKFSGSGTSYSKSDVDKARDLLKEKTPKQEPNNDEDTYYEEPPEKMDPATIGNRLYGVGISDTKLQEARNNFSRKREDVFAYRLSKAFKKHNLPYRVDTESWHDMLIERVS